MSQQDIDQGLDQFSDEELAEILEFVEQMGSLEDAQAALDALSQVQKAA